MTKRNDIDALLRSLAAPGRYAVALAGISLSVLAGCVVHAIVAARGEGDAHSLAMTRRLSLTDLALVPYEDLRHPGWGRPEQARAGQPGLPDPRGVRVLVRPPAIEVIK